MHDQALDQEIDYQDFQEAPAFARPPGFSPLVIGICGALAGLLLAVLLIRGSMPELTPEQIVAMDGYEGQQPPRYIFNLDSLSRVSNVSVSSLSRVSNVSVTSNGAPVAGNASAGNSVANHANKGVEVSSNESNRPEVSVDVARGGSPANVVSTRIVNRPAMAESGSNNKSPEVGSELPEAASELSGVGSSSPGVGFSSIVALLATVEPQDSWPLEIVEVPASPVIIGKDAQELAAPVVEEFDYRKLNRRNLSAQVQDYQKQNVNGFGANLPIYSTGEREIDGLTTEVRVLPVLDISRDYSYLRAEPSRSSEILLTLGKGSSVTAFESAGAWIHAGANDGSSITGYLHHSMVELAEVD